MNEENEKKIRYTKEDVENSYKTGYREAVKRAVETIDGEYTKLFREQLCLEQKREEYAFMYYDIVREAVWALKGEQG